MCPLFRYSSPLIPGLWALELAHTADLQTRFLEVEAPAWICAALAFG